MADPTAIAELAPARLPPSALIEVEARRAIADTTAAMQMAKMSPRDPLAALDKILAACSRQSLAEQAAYSYTRGGSEITGPTIRIAEMLAQYWGNIDFGIRELSQSNGESTVEAFALDLETLTRRRMTFQVPHLRYSRKGIEKLTDPRDIYELVANNGARRLRSCILAVIPGDIVDAAMKQCDETLKNSGGAPAEQIKQLVAAFSEIGVTAEMLTRKLNHKLDAVNMAEVLRLKKIYRGIRDGFTTAAVEFEIGDPGAPGEAQQPPKSAREAASRAARRGSTTAKDSPPQGDSPGASPARRSYAQIREAMETAAKTDEPAGALAELAMEAKAAVSAEQAKELNEFAATLLDRAHGEQKQ